MKRDEFNRLIRSRILVMDGAMGTALMSAGLTVEQCLELCNQERSELVRSIHRAHIEAGADIISTNTFGANSYRLAKHGLSSTAVTELVKRGCYLARQEAGSSALVALSVGPTGSTSSSQPGEFERLIAIFYQQIMAGYQEGIDLISLETMLDIHELKAAVIAARKVCQLPILAQLSFGKEQRTWTGTDPATAGAILSGLDIDMMGSNCAAPLELLQSLLAMSKTSHLPLIAQPNAGLPSGDGSYPIGADEMAGYLAQYSAAGVRVIGSCCGSTPAHTAALVAASRRIEVAPLAPPARASYLASGTSYLRLGDGHLPLIIGERIHTRGRPELIQALEDADPLFFKDEATEQRITGAQVLNINLGELEGEGALAWVAATVQKATGLALSLDSEDLKTLESSLRVVRGRPLLNYSTDGEILKTCYTMAKEYGAMMVVRLSNLVNNDADPKSVLTAVEQILVSAESYGLHSSDIVIDPCPKGMSRGDLALILSRVRLLKEFKTTSLVAVSNISRGQRVRSPLNAAFAAMAVGAGVNLLIANPLQREVVSMIKASAQLVVKEETHDTVYNSQN